jgi:RHS repeat-associated protein
LRFRILSSGAKNSTRKPAGPDLHSVPILSLIKDDNKQITSIQYNHLNLPVHIDIATKPAQEGGRIEYLYDAAGIKLRQTKYIGATPDEETNYIGNFAYEGESSLKYIITDDGRLIPKTGGGFEYEYFIKDHLGNTRLTVQDSSGFAAIKQENHYYPFGMVMSGQSWRNSTQTTRNDYLYNGKEFQDELGLDWYDYGARFYDPQIGRWHSVDPMSEKRNWLSPYQYVQNNPLVLIDPTGALDTKYEDEHGRTLLETNDGNNSVITVKKGQMSNFIEKVRGMIKSGKLHDKKSNVELIDAVTPATEGVFFTNKQMAWMYAANNKIENFLWVVNGGVIAEPTKGKDIDGVDQENDIAHCYLYLPQKQKGSSLIITLNNKEYSVIGNVHDHPYRAGWEDSNDSFSGCAWDYPDGKKYYTGDIGSYHIYKNSGIRMKNYLIGPQKVSRYNVYSKGSEPLGETSDLLNGKDLIK